MNLTKQHQAALFLIFSIFAVNQNASATATQDSFAKGFDLLKAGKSSKAAAIFEKGLKEEPDNALAHFYLGEAYFNLKKIAKAQEHFRTSLEIDSNSRVAEIANIRLIQSSEINHEIQSTDDIDYMVCNAISGSGDTDDHSCLNHVNCELPDSSDLDVSIDEQNGDCKSVAHFLYVQICGLDFDDKTQQFNKNKLGSWGKFEYPLSDFQQSESELSMKYQIENQSHRISINRVNGEGLRVINYSNGNDFKATLNCHTEKRSRKF